MKDTESVLEADLDYAVRMVQSGCATLEQAAQTCGVRLEDVQERLDHPPAQYAPAQRKPIRFDP